MKILGIDPGNTHSAWVVYDTEAGRPEAKGYDHNSELVLRLEAGDIRADMLVIEMIACYGMPVGREVFETCTWIGRFEWAARRSYGITHRLYRTEIKTHLCGTPRAKDPNVAQALKDRFGGSSCKGTKKAPGPLYGFAGDMWAALAVAVTWAETKAA